MKHVMMGVSHFSVGAQVTVARTKKKMTNDLMNTVGCCIYRGHGTLHTSYVALFRGMQTAAAHVLELLLNLHLLASHFAKIVALPPLSRSTGCREAKPCKHMEILYSVSRIYPPNVHRKTNSVLDRQDLHTLTSSVPIGSVRPTNESSRSGFETPVQS
ncbi:hypothetical protein ACHAW6_005512 [Cyclotella cf. meneghiniana]